MGGALVEALGAETALGTYSHEPLTGGVRLDLAEAAERPELADEVLRGGAVEVVFVAAAMTNVDACEGDEESAMRVNRDGPEALARAARARGARTVLFSTEYVFDGRDGPYGESDPPHPVSVYGRSKLEGEERVLAVDPDALVLRTTVVYGPEARGRNFAYRLGAELSAGRPLRAPADQISSPTYNRDLAGAAVELAAGGVRGVVNVVGPETMDRARFACRVAAAAGLDPALVRPIDTAALDQRAERPLRAGLRIDRLRELLPHVHMRTVEEAVSHWLTNQRGRPWPTS